MKRKDYTIHLLIIAIITYVLSVLIWDIKRDNKYEYHKQEIVNGIQYYVISNKKTGVGIEYATMNEIQCFLRTETFNYFTSDPDTYKNGVFVKF